MKSPDFFSAYSSGLAAVRGSAHSQRRAFGVLLAAAASGLTAQAATDHPDVFTRAEHYQAPAIQLLERLVNIDSGTGHAAGLEKVMALAVEEMTRLGAKIEETTAAPMAGKNVTATFTGTGKGRILLIAHLDTVFKEGTAKERPFRIENGRAYGPGVSDNKSGFIAALFALKILGDLKFSNYGMITVLLNPNEEVGSIGSRQLIANLSKKHDYALNLEAGRIGDKVVFWRKGSELVELTVKGRGAHAGVAPQNGRNAAMEVAHQVLQLSQIGDKEKLTTINFTIIQSGDRSNVIPDLAVAKADVRAVSEEEFARVQRDLANGIKNKLIPDTDVSFRTTRSFPPFPKNAATDALVARAQRIYAEIGRTLDTEGSGGASDSSLTAAAGAASLDGLGIVGGNAHAADEYTDLTSIPPRLYLLARMLMELGPGR